MDAQLRALISALHGAGLRLVLTATGGGAGAAAWLLSVPGGSRSVLEVIIPYDERSLEEFLGHCPASFCSEETARSMARRALERARWLAPGQTAVGIACTASLRSERPKRGDHRFHLAIHTDRHLSTFSLTLAKEARSREEEENVLDRVLLNALAEALALPQRVEVSLLPSETIERRTSPADDALLALVEGRQRVVCVERDGRFLLDAPRPLLLLPGSFNPLHTGHLALAETAARLTGLAAAFGLTIVNADKPPLSLAEVRRRLASFAWKAPLWLTRAPTFAAKAELFPGAVFVVGADTAERILQARFYGGSESQLQEAMDTVRRSGCRFLVAGRLNPEGDFIDLDRIRVPPLYADLFAAIPASRFRVDLCSTHLRATNC